MKNDISFEYALEKLENIATRLENGNESLDCTVKLFHEGMLLVKMCREKLNNAEKEAGEFETKIDIGDE